MRFVVGCDTGVARSIFSEQKEVLGRWGTPAKNTSVDELCWGPEDSKWEGTNVSQTKVYMAKSTRLNPKSTTYNSTVQLWDTEEDTTQECLSIPGIVRNMYYIKKEKEGHLIVANHIGDLNVYSSKKDEYKVVSELKCGGSSGKVSKARLDIKKYKHGALECAVGGEENELSIYNLENSEKIWSAKNVALKNALRVPVHVMNIQYMQGDFDGKIATSTAQGNVRIYDVRATQRRPVMDKNVTPFPIVCLENGPDGSTMFISDTRGLLAEYDMRKGRILHTYKGVTGSTRSLQLHPTVPVIVACGLDRFVRIYGTKSRKLENKLYLKFMMNSILFTREPRVRNRELRKRLAIKTEDGEDQEFDDPTVDIFEGIEKVGAVDEDEESKVQVKEEPEEIVVAKPSKKTKTEVIKVEDGDDDQDEMSEDSDDDDDSDDDSDEDGDDDSDGDEEGAEGSQVISNLMTSEKQMKDIDDVDSDEERKKNARKQHPSGLSKLQRRKIADKEKKKQAPKTKKVTPVIIKIDVSKFKHISNKKIK